MTAPTDFIRPEIKNMTAYHVTDVPENFIKLDAMESPYHPFHPPYWRNGRGFWRNLRSTVTPTPHLAACNPHCAKRSAFLRQRRLPWVTVRTN